MSNSLRILSVKLPVRAFLVLAALSSAQATAQALDQAAYNMVWDRLGVIIPSGTSSESVHALRIIVPATWALGSEDSLSQLQDIAGAIPDNNFVLDPSRLQLKLHDMYANFVLDVELPTQDPAQEAAFLKAQKEYRDAQDAYIKRLDGYLDRWSKYKQDATERGEPINTATRQKFRKSLPGYFSYEQAQLDAAMKKIQQFAPVANQYVQAVRRLRDHISNAQSDLVGIYDYEGGAATLATIMSDCADTGPGWDELKFTHTVSSKETRTSSWNGGGAWDGPFLRIGGGAGGTSYSDVFKDNNNSLELRFCKLTYVPVRAGQWFDPSFLRTIDSGGLKLKANSPYYGRKAFGPDGAIPYLVKGLVVARRISFVANLDQSYIGEFKKNINGSGGVRIGPFRIGGSGGSTEFRKETDDQTGMYGRSTDSTVPVILAVVTEPTS